MELELYDDFHLCTFAIKLAISERQAERGVQKESFQIKSDYLLKAVSRSLFIWRSFIFHFFFALSDP
jgi:hypothetical protein